MNKRWEVLDERIIIQLLVSPQTGTLITLDFKGFVKFWNQQEARVEQELASVPEKNRSIEISPDENHLVVMSFAGSRLYQKISGVFEAELFSTVYSTGHARFTPDSKKLLLGVMDSILALNIATGNLSSEWEDTGERCAGIALHPDNDLLAVCECWSAGSELTLLRLSNSEYCKSIWLNYDELTQPSFSADGTWLGVSHWIPIVYAMRDIENQKQNKDQENLRNEEKWVASPLYQFGSDGQLLLIFERSSTVKTQQMWTRQVFEMKRNVVIAGSPQGKIFAWNLSDGSIRSQIQAHEGEVFDIALSIDGNTLISCGADSYLRTWNLD